MDQNPLPRGSSQVCDRPGQGVEVVLELAETAVAVEAEYPADPSGAMIVVQMFRIGTPADRAHVALLGQELLELLLPDPVATTQVVLTTTAVEPLPRFLALLVVARLAVSAVTTPPGPIAREVVKHFRLAACRATTVAIRNGWQLPHLSPLLLLQAPGVARLRTKVEAGLAVTAPAVRATTVGAELFERLPLVAVPTTTVAIPVVRALGHVRFDRLCPTPPLFVRSP